MKRFCSLALALLWLLGGLAVVRADAPRTTRKSENTLLIMTEGLRWQEMFGGVDAEIQNKENGDRQPARGANALSVTLDTSESPDLEDWAQKAKGLCETWYPRIVKMLQSPNFTPPNAIKLVFKKDYDGVAATSGTTIEISAKWVQQHPDDFGMVIHELTHVVQSYPSYDAGWLVEGIADYIRFFQFEPRVPRPRINPDKASYRDAYRTTAAFLAWTESKYDKKLVNKLNAALRAGQFDEALFKKSTGKEVTALWEEFLQALRTKRAGRFATLVQADKAKGTGKP